MITTDEELLKHGFKKYKASAISNDSIKYLFQKRYDNEQGDTLYFLDINKWDWSFAGDRVPEKYTYQIETQLYKKGDHEAINVEFGSNITVEDAEKFIQAMFDADLIEPYSCDE